MSRLYQHWKITTTRDIVLYIEAPDLDTAEKRARTNLLRREILDSGYPAFGRIAQIEPTDIDPAWLAIGSLQQPEKFLYFPQNWWLQRGI